MEVNYKNKKYYNTAKYPIRQPKIMTFLLYLVSKVALMFGPKYKIEKINFSSDNLFCSHSQMGKPKEYYRQGHTYSYPRHRFHHSNRFLLR